MNRVWTKCEERDQFFDWFFSLLSLYDDDTSFLRDNELYQISKLGIRRRILAQNFSNPIDQALRDLVLDAIISADYRAPGAGIWVPFFFQKEITKRIHKRENTGQYLSHVIKLSNDDLTKEIFSSIYDLAGPMTNIRVKKSHSKEVIIRVVDKFSFPLQLDPIFHKMIGQTDLIELSNPDIIMIEGAPETVGEINSLLEKNHESKKPVILICRNFQEEISATLATNWLKGTLSVIPILYGDTISTINLASDMMSITQGELITSHFGDVVSSAVIDPAKIGVCDFAEWSRGNLKISKNIDVTGQINKLLAKIEKTEEEDLKSILSDRISSLSNNSIQVEIPEAQTRVFEELDMLIKHYNAFIVGGSVETNAGILPAAIVETAQQTAESLEKEILNIAGFLTREYNGSSMETGWS